jgi:hypothetical protein
MSTPTLQIQRVFAELPSSVARYVPRSPPFPLRKGDAYPVSAPFNGFQIRMARLVFSFNHDVVLPKERLRNPGSPDQLNHIRNIGE